MQFLSYRPLKQSTCYVPFPYWNSTHKLQIGPVACCSWCMLYNIVQGYLYHRVGRLYIGILHQTFRLSLTLSLLHIIIKEASRYKLVFVP